MIKNRYIHLVVFIYQQNLAQTMIPHSVGLVNDRRFVQVIVEFAADSADGTPLFLDIHAF